MTILSKSITLAAALCVMASASSAQEVAPMNWEKLEKLDTVTDPIEDLYGSPTPQPPYYDECCGAALNCDRYCPPDPEALNPNAIWGEPEASETEQPEDTNERAKSLTREHQDLIDSIYE